MNRIIYILIIISLLAVAAGCAEKEKTSTLQMIPESAPVERISITAEKYKFTPDTITVSKGTHLVLDIKSLDVRHEFKLEGYDIYSKLPPGKMVRVEIYATKTGEFEFGCHVGLGAHYRRGMKGKLIVTE